MSSLAKYAFSLAALTGVPTATSVYVGQYAFDFFVFATSWQPEFCYNQPSYVGCSSPDPLWSSQLTIHGAWPQNATGAWPDTCTTEAFDVSNIDAIGIETFYLNWPNVKAAQTASDYDAFWEHEWTKHGTCAQMTQKDYFNSVVNARPTTPSIVAANYGKTVAKADLIAAYGTVVAPMCIGTGTAYLSEVFVCVDKSFKAIDCPNSVVAEGNCGTTISIGTFNDMTGPSHRKKKGVEVLEQ